MGDRWERIKCEEVAVRDAPQLVGVDRDDFFWMLNEIKRLRDENEILRRTIDNTDTTLCNPITEKLRLEAIQEADRLRAALHKAQGNADGTLEYYIEMERERDCLRTELAEKERECQALYEKAEGIYPLPPTERDEKNAEIEFLNGALAAAEERVRDEVEREDILDICPQCSCDRWPERVEQPALYTVWVHLTDTSRWPCDAEHIWERRFQRGRGEGK